MHGCRSLIFIVILIELDPGLVAGLLQEGQRRDSLGLRGVRWILHLRVLQEDGRPMLQREVFLHLTGLLIEGQIGVRQVIFKYSIHYVLVGSRWRIQRNRDSDLEKGILEAFGGGGTLGGIEMQHVLNELNGFFGRILDYGGKGLRNALRKLVTKLLGKFKAIRPLLSGGGTEHFANLHHLVLLALAWKQWSHGEELGHDGSHGEDINGRIVVGISEQNFRRSVPASTYVVSVWGSGIDLFGESKVRNLDCIMVAK